MTEGVFEKYRIATYKEASWKPYIIAAMILSRKYAKTALLEQLLKEAQERVNRNPSGRSAGRPLYFQRPKG